MGVVDVWAVGVIVVVVVENVWAVVVVVGVFVGVNI